MFRTEKKLGSVKSLISIYRSVDVKIYIYFNSDVTVRLDNLSGPQHAGFGLRTWVFWLSSLKKSSLRDAEEGEPDEQRRPLNSPFDSTRQAKI